MTVSLVSCTHRFLKGDAKLSSEVNHLGRLRLLLEMSQQKLNKPDLRIQTNRFRSALYAAIFISVACVPIILKPFFDSSTYQKVQNQMRPLTGKTREELQPGGLRPWSHPFKPRED